MDHVHFSAETEGAVDCSALADDIRQWARDLGFGALSISDVDLGDAEPGLERWLAAGFHGEMHYMARHGLKRARPAELVPGTIRVISVRMNYWPNAEPAGAVLADRSLAYVSRYALGRDYHKVLRARLQKLADRIVARAPSAHRVFVDSAPVLEVELGVKGGLGWRGKHTLLIDRAAGSYFFLGEIFTDLPLPTDPGASAHCGSCTSCMTACPTGAIVAPYRVDARRCISYLTIELEGVIPEDLRPLLGNRIYGCDDCQLVCPWNRFAQRSVERDFEVRHGLDCASLVSLFAWSEDEFLARTAGSPIHRIGYERWIRNIAVALGNAEGGPEVIEALRAREEGSSAVVREHVQWALAQHVRGG
ncbi:MAG: tRNA epoxyqueuosine(34) reductase QueG [Azoarcus sp.]|nr:tRNA epoxyqueuosine(34) reductase QueG [Azoarcus sp.]